MADGKIVIDTKVDQKGVDKGLKTMQSKLQATAKTAKTAGLKMSAALTTPILALGGIGMNAAMDFSSAMVVVSNGLGVAGGEAEALTEIANDVYKKGFGQSLPETSQALVDVKKNFQDLVSDADLGQVTQDAMVLAQTLGEDVNWVARAGTTLMKEFGTTSTEAFDLIAWGSQNGINFSQEMLDNIAEYGPLFSEMGYSAEEYFALMANGAEEGAYNLDYINDVMKEFQIRLKDGSKATDDAMAQMSDSTNQVWQSFLDGEATVQDVMSVVTEELQGMDSTTANLIGTDLFGTKWEDLGADAVLAMGNIEGGLEGLDGSMATMSDNVEQSLGNQFQSLLRETGDALRPVGQIAVDLAKNFLPPLIDAISSVAEWFSNLSPAAQMTIIAILGIVAAIGPLLMAAGFIIQGFIAIIPILKLVGAGLMALTSPIGIIIAVVVALTIVIISNWEAIWTVTKEVFSAIADLLVEVWDVIVEALIVAWDWIVEAATVTFTALGEFFTGLWNGIKDGSIAIWETISQFLVDVWNGILEFATPIFTAIWEFIQGVWTVISTITMAIWNVITTILIAAWNGLLEFVIPIFTAIWEFIVNVWTWITESSAASWNLIMEVLTAIWNGLLAIVTPIFTAIWNFIVMVWTWISETTMTVWAAIVEVLAMVWNVIYTNAIAIFTTIWNYIVMVWNVIMSVTAGVWGIISSILQGIWTAISGIATSVFSAIMSVITSIWNTIKSVTSSVWNTIKAVVSAIWSGIKALASGEFNSIKGIITVVWNTIKSVSSSVWNGIKSTLSSIWNGLKSTVTSIFDGIKGAITGAWDSITSATTSTWDGVTGTVKGAVNGIIAAVNGMINGLNSLKIKLPTVPDWVPGLGGSGGQTLGFNIPNIPSLDVGTNFVAQDGLAMIHRGEAIVPAEHNGPYEPDGGSRKPAIINLTLGSSNFRAFVEDITEFQERDKKTQEMFKE